jgi:putative two-component system response regulator
MRILVADDNLFYRQALGTILKEWGYQVTFANDGVEAMAVLERDDSPKLAIIDVMMPKIDGLEVCRRVRTQETPEPPYLVILTAQHSKKDIVKALESGADDFIAKPFDHEELKARIRVGARTVGLQRSQTIVFTFARAVEAKSPFTQGHSDRVKTYCLAMADRLKLSAKDKEILRTGALLHDIGKISVPDAILNKPGALTEAEFAVMKQHPSQGVQIVEPLESLAEVIPLIRWHHERLDGSGYPDGLKADQIPFLVQLLSVADCLDALTSARPYRAALPLVEVVHILRRDVCKGKMDSALVDCVAAVGDDLGIGRRAESWQVAARVEREVQFAEL